MESNSSILGIFGENGAKVLLSKKGFDFIISHFSKPGHLSRLREPDWRLNSKYLTDLLRDTDLKVNKHLQLTQEKAFLAFVGSWKGEETSDELNQSIYEGRNDDPREIDL